MRVEQIANVSSTDITLAHWLTLANRINAIFASEPRVAGVVITHGTNTLEETAYFLNLTVKHDRPVVLVGSMRPASAISADGPLNLLNAVRTAVSTDARGKGALVVLNDAINGARDVTKTNTYRVETFRATELAASATSTRMRSPSTARRSSGTRHARSSTSRADQPAAGGDRLFLRAAEHGAGAGARRGRCAGHRLCRHRRGPDLDGRARGAGARMPDAPRPVLVRSNRTGNGRVIAQNDYDAMGMVPADNLNPQKARVLLMLALTRTRDLAELRACSPRPRGPSGGPPVYSTPSSCRVRRP